MAEAQPPPAVPDRPPVVGEAVWYWAADRTSQVYGGPLYERLTPYPATVVRPLDGGLTHLAVLGVRDVPSQMLFKVPFGAEPADNRWTRPVEGWTQGGWRPVA